MKIIVMNPADVRIELLNVPDHMLEDDTEQFLVEHGYSLNNISWMAAPVDFVPVQFHDYGTIANSGEEIHVSRDAKLKDFPIYDSVQEVKKREHEELVKALRLHGKEVDGGYEFHFEDECPIIAAYSWDEPCDVVVLAAKVDEDGDITLIVDEKNDRGNEHELDPDEAFAGHLDYVIDAVK